MELIQHLLRILLKVPRSGLDVLFFLADLEPVLVEIIQKGKVIFYFLVGDEIVVRGHSSR